MARKITSYFQGGLCLPLILAPLLAAGLPLSTARAAEPGDQSLSGDASAVEERPFWRQNLFRRFLADQKFLFTTWVPYEVRRPGFTVPLVAGVMLAASSSHAEYDSLDLEMERHFEASVGAERTSTARAFTNLGNGATGILLIGTGYLVGRWSGHDSLSEASSLSAEALLDTGLWTSVLKKITARTRPTGGAEGDFFSYQPDRGQSNDSFPSGHAAGAFAVATVFSGVYSEHRWVPWVAYGTAGLVGASRVGLGRHFPSDVLVGALIGNSFGRMVLARQRGLGERGSSLQPFMDPAQRQAGLLWTKTW